MSKKIFLAGATGLIRRALIPLLQGADYVIIAMTRSLEGKAALESFGVKAEVVDGFDRRKPDYAMKAAAPGVVIHQLTDPSSGIDPSAPQIAIERNARIRREGTANHLAVTVMHARATRVIAQSIAWAYFPKVPPLHSEINPLDVAATRVRAIIVGEGIVPLEGAVLRNKSFEGIILRHGQLYGPDTWSPEPQRSVPVHVDAAAYAAFLAVDRAINGLGWNPALRFKDGKHVDRA